MKTRTWAIVAAIATAVGVTIMATRGSDTPSDFSVQEDPAGTGVVVAEGDGWTLERFDNAGQCYLLRIDDATTYCQSTEYPDGSWTGKLAEGNGHRLAVVLYGSEDPLTGRWFSNVDRGRSLASTQVRPGIVAFVVDLQDGEEPYGMQVVDTTGAVISAVSFVS